MVKNYLWLRETAVGPERQSRGIAKGLVGALLKDAVSLQPVATYIWPEEISFLQGALERVGFEPTGEQPVKIFGEAGEPVRQVRLQAASARSVLENL